MTLFYFMGEHPILTVIVVFIVGVFLYDIVATICETVVKVKNNG